MRTVKRVSVLILLAGALGACASTPSRHGSAGNLGVQSSLSLCSGLVISNAPASDASRRIINYDPQAEVRGKTLLRAPVKSCVSSGFGPRRGGASSFHHGVDLYTRDPSSVYAGGDGVVEAVQTMRGYGKTVLIRHGQGVQTRYAHLSSYASSLRKGSRIAIGDFIGHTGRTGNATAVHLHYEVLIDGRRHNPLTVGH